MNTRAIREIIRREPFSPVTFVMSSGDRFELRHRENIILGKDMAIVYNPEREVNAVGFLSYLHIADVVPSGPLATAGQQNGQAGG